MIRRGLYAGVFVWLLASPAFAVPRFLMIDLGTFWAFAIANDGTMAGSLVDPNQHAARGTAASIEPLDLGGAAWAQSLSGLTVGDGGISVDGVHYYQEAIAWDAAGTPMPLGRLPGGLSSAATCISGIEIGGGGDDAQQVVHPLLFANGQLTQLPTLGYGGFLNGCNGTHQRVGWVNTPEALLHAALWDPDGTFHDLGTLGGTQSVLEAINEAGEAVGWSTDASEYFYAMRWSAATGQQALTAPAGYVGCSALGLNNRGAIVGQCDPNLGYPATRAVLWAAGGGPGLDLNTLVEDSQGLTLTSALSPNDVGMIIGLGSTAQGERHGVLLVPAILENFARLWTWLGLPPLP